MENWKYVVLDMPQAETIIIFPPHLTHADMTMGFPAVSAGFLSFRQSTKKFFCYGSSSSLGIPSRPDEDAWYANKLLNPRDL